MRLSSLSWSLFLGAAALVNPAAGDDAGDDATEDLTRENTYFNNQKVPPVLELTPDNFEREVHASKYMLIKHHSPWCPHCQDFAPTFQTLYEYYYTSKPAGSAAPDSTDFTTFYGLRFATLNCIAYYDLCVANGVQSYPTTMLFKDGQLLESFRGVKNISFLSEAIEKVLEEEKPGTRPKQLLLPTAGAKEAPAATADAAAPVQAKAEAEAVAAPAPAAAVADPGSQKKIAKSAVTPNPNGVSVLLTAESFQSMVTMTRDPWFVKFYAPWCHHCQAMKPNWEQLAKAMKGRLNVGEVNCDVEKRLCKDAHVRGYPTILFFRGGERIEYDGLRGFGDFVSYAEKALDVISGVPEVDAESFKALEAKEEVIFVYFYDHATTSEDFMALERLPMNLIGHAKLVKTKDPALCERFKITTWPRLLVSREGRPTYYTPLTPNLMRETRKVLEWMKSVWLPLIPEMTASNAREIMDGKIVVLGILKRDNEESFTSAIREMKSAATEWMDKQVQLFQLERQELRDAKQLRIEEAEDRGDQRALRAAKAIHVNMDKTDRKEVSFAWVDGVFWQRWVRTTYGIDVKDGDRVIINDEDNRRYWDQTITGNHITASRTSILETINKVVAQPPKIKPKLTISSIEKIFFDIRMTFSEHPYLSLGCVLGLALGGASWFRGRLRRTRGHFRLDEPLGMKEHKAPLLGLNSDGKVD